MFNQFTKRTSFIARMATCLFAILGFAALEGIALGTSALLCLAGAGVLFAGATYFALYANYVDRTIRARKRRAKLHAIPGTREAQRTVPAAVA